MALMIPHKCFDTQSDGEVEVFRALESGLDDNYIVFHSVRWVTSSQKSQGEADFLILHRSLGIIVIEVKSGFIRCENRSWFQKNRNTLVEREIQDPMNQADSSKFKFVEVLQNPANNIRNCLVCHAVWFPSIHWAFPYPPHYAPELVFDKISLSSPQEVIEGAFSYWSKSAFSSSYNREVFDRLKFIIAPEFSAVPSVRANFEYKERMFITLTRDQARIMDFLDEQRIAVISGSAGTGKTMLALEKANRLGIKNEHTLFLCFNDALKDHLERNNPISFVSFRTIRELAQEFLLVDPKWSLNELTDQLGEMLIDKKKLWRYKNVIIDEAQDFNTLFIEILKDVTEGCFYAFYDKNQSIYQTEPLHWANNAECKLTLHTNCRNTKEIARTSARNIGLDSKTFVNSPVNGEQAFVAEYIDELSCFLLTEKIVQYLVGIKNATPEDIVVLSMKDKYSFIRNKSSLCGFATSQFLSRGKICVNSVDEFKGLEAPYLILIDIVVANYADNHYRNRLYIGCSRAKHGLYMLLNNPSDQDYSIAMNAIESKSKMKKTKSTFYKKLAVVPLEI